MLIARAPVRISFAGGGTDLPAYYERYGGLVVSATIDRYFYAFINPTNNGSLQVTSSDYRTFYRQTPGREPLFDTELSLPRAILRHFGFETGLSIFLASQVPPGTGLGSSSTVATTLIKGLSTLRGVRLTAGAIAELAARIEIDQLGFPIGKQDQYAAAFGGINRFTFTREAVEVEPLHLPLDLRQALEQRLLLFFLGGSRHSGSVLNALRWATLNDDPVVLESLDAIKAFAHTTERLLRAGDLDGLGSLLDESWQQKRKLAPGIANERIDHAYQTARAAGALGGKIAGAGGGGFLMVLAGSGREEAITQALEAEQCPRMDYHFEFGGARVLMNAAQSVREIAHVG